MRRILDEINKKRAEGRKSIAILVDPDKYDARSFAKAIASGGTPDYIFVGGSMVCNDTETVVKSIKEETDSDVILFPGDYMQLAASADALMLLSLISGRNPEYLIGQHVKAAPRIAKSGIEAIPTAYILIDGGTQTSVEYVSNTRPIPSGKIDLITATAMAGEQLGLKATYLEAGSGAKKAVSADAIKAVREATSTPLIVGGGIRTTESAKQALKAGADIIVVGTAIEQNPSIATELIQAVSY